MLLLLLCFIDLVSYIRFYLAIKCGTMLCSNTTYVILKSMLREPVSVSSIDNARM